MRFPHISNRSALLAAALAMAPAAGVPTLGADAATINHGPCLGQGDSHDRAYNSAYAQCRTTIGFACGVAGGHLADVSISTEADFNYGRGFYQVILTMRASCET